MATDVANLRGPLHAVKKIGSLAGKVPSNVENPSAGAVSADVGTRTIVAIRLDRDDPNWYHGPPYIAKEMVFDEQEIAACHLTEEEAIKAAIHEHETSGHPGFQHEVFTQMMQVRYKDPHNRYPHKGVLRFDRHRPDGEILHPYAGRKDGEEWIVELYLPFLRTYGEMREREFIALPIATAADVRARADRQSTA